MEHQHQAETPVKPAKMDHSGMDHSAMQHGGNPAMGMEGHNHHKMMMTDFKKRFYVVLVLTIPILLLSTMIQRFMGVVWQFRGSQYILFALSSVVFFYGGWPFLKKLTDEVVAKSTALSAKNGLLIKNRTAFENARKITTIVFDKTGTLTVGKFEVSKIVSLQKDLSENEIIRFASALELRSEHPIATGIMQKVAALSVVIPATENFNAITGKGVEATVEGKKIMVVSPGYLKEVNMPLPKGFSANDTETVVFVLIDNNLVGYIALSDKIRPESIDTIQTLKQNGIKSILLTGDNSKVAKSVSETLGMDSFIAEVLPHEKLEKIKELQAMGEFVAMTGDGVNDAPALAIADVGIAVGSSSDIAAETAGIVLVNSNPKDIVSLVLFGKATYNKMMQNLIWATGYNVVALPLAAGVLYHWGILLSPAAGAVLMTASTIVVAINASRLKVK